MKKTKILWTAEHCCIRVIKQARALLKTGRYEIHGLAKQVSFGTDAFDTFGFYHNRRQFENAVRLSDVDLYIHSNEPNWQLNVIRDLKPGAKIILDAHDMDSLRLDAISVDEHRALTNCNGVLFVSKEVRDYICELHADQLRGKPVEVLEHYCSEEFFLPEHDGPRTGLVYEGGAQSPPYKGKAFRYRHLYPVFRQLVDQGHEVHLMFGNPDATRTYANIGAYVYEPQVYDQMMKALQSRRWGMVVFNNEDLSQVHVNLTRTNKEQEYLCCGLPLIVCGAPATAEYARHFDIGLCFDRIDQIRPEVLEEAYPHLKANVETLRPTLTMERHIHRVETLIKQVVTT